MRSHRSSASSRCDNSVEPTRSAKRMINCRRWAGLAFVSSAGARSSSDVPAAIAAKISLRWPTGPTPISFKSTMSRCGRTASSIAWVLKAAAYCSRPSSLRIVSTPITLFRSREATDAANNDGGSGNCHGPVAASRTAPLTRKLTSRSNRQKAGRFIAKRDDTSRLIIWRFICELSFTAPAASAG